MDEKMYNFLEERGIRYVDMEEEGWAIEASSYRCMLFLYRFHDRLEIVSVKPTETGRWEIHFGITRSV
jgi:hypothetical protein